MEIKDFFIDIGSNKIESILDKEPRVKKWIKFGDINLQTITGAMILQNAKSCFKVADNALFFYKKALNETKYIETIDLCNERIRLVNNAKAVIEPYLQKFHKS